MKEKVVFKMNVPVELCLAGSEGKEMEGHFDESDHVQPERWPGHVRAPGGTRSGQKARSKTRRAIQHLQTCDR